MARIELRQLAHAYRPNPASEADYALQPLQLVWEDGGAYALLGPSGCGKTTLLNIISGLVRPSHGRVLFDGKDVTDLSPQQRNIAQVFQFPVIYDTMTVFDNLAFPLRNRGVDEPSIRKRVGQIAEMLELVPDLSRRASGLTADAKQKISLGRGLVRSDVAAILFDEPLTVIDPHLKWQLRRKLKQIHQELKLTLVYVTHDQVEALTFADKVVVMSAGRVMQAGSAEELFEQPQHTFVGHFIGSPGMNFLPVVLRSGGEHDAGLVIDGQSAVGSLERDLTERLRAAGQSGAVKLGIRPEYVAVVPPGTVGSVPARVTRLQNLGTSQILTAQVGASTVRARLPLDADLRVGAASGGGAGAHSEPKTVHLSLCNQHSCFYANEELLR